MEPKSRLNYLFTRYLENQSSPEEAKAFLSFFDTKDEEALLQLIVAQFKLEDEISISLLKPDKEVLDQVFLKISNRINKPKVFQIRIWNKWLKYVAALVLLILSPVILYYFNYDPTKRELEQLAENDIAPGTNKAYLTLANGKRILLTDSINGKIAVEAGIEISKTTDGLIIYTLKDPDQVINVQFNTIETPKGGQYQICLPDGTRVWLNAASKLTYPVSFATQRERKVELSGEAYFEVAKLTTKDKSVNQKKPVPFIVKTRAPFKNGKGQEVQVLGTRFNINSYNNIMKTTLLEGSIKVTAYSSANDFLSDHATILKPGQQAIQHNGDLETTVADAEKAVDWKNGWFYFKSNSLSEVLAEAANWYDLKIIYAGKVPDEHFTGKVPRTASLSKFIKMLELSAVKFKMKDKTMIISSF